MRIFLFVFLLSAVGVGGYWYYQRQLQIAQVEALRNERLEKWRGVVLEKLAASQNNRTSRPTCNPCSYSDQRY